MSPTEIAPYPTRDEVILWHGGPTRNFAPGVFAIFPVLFGLLFTSIAAYAVYRVMMDVQDGLH